MTAALRAALHGVLADPALAATRAALRLSGIALIDRSAYGIVPALEEAAVGCGYPVLA